MGIAALYAAEIASCVVGSDRGGRGASSVCVTKKLDRRRACDRAVLCASSSSASRPARCRTVPTSRRIAARASSCRWRSAACDISTGRLGTRGRSSGSLRLSFGPEAWESVELSMPSMRLLRSLSSGAYRGLRRGSAPSAGLVERFFPASASGLYEETVSGARGCSV